MIILLLTVLGETISDGWEQLNKFDYAAYSVGDWAQIAPSILVLGIVLWRGVLRLIRGAPALPGNEPAMAKKITSITHMLLYLLVFLIVGTGLWAWYASSGTIGSLHKTLRLLVMIVILLHAAAALYHHFILRTNVMRRMLGAEK